MNAKNLEKNEDCLGAEFAKLAPAGKLIVQRQPYYKKLNKQQTKKVQKKKLYENPLLEKPQLSDVYNFAKEKHDKTGIVRSVSKKPYFTHPEMVADIVLAYGGTDEEIAIALLHDTVEDTNTTIEEIEKTYGEIVAEIVSEITNDPVLVKKYGKENYINKELLEIDHSALFIKLCDMYANILEHPTKDQKKRILNNVEYLIRYRYEDLDNRERTLLKSFPGLDFNLGKSEIDYLN